MALAHLWQANLPWTDDLPPVIALTDEEKRLLKAQLERKLNTPFTSSMGRLFDAAASLIGIRQQATYEAQAAIEMEALADLDEQHFYPIAFQDDQIDPAPIWHGLIADLRAGVSQPVLAARFHKTIAQINLDVCLKIRSEHGITVVALSGGVWQNRVLFQKTTALLETNDFTVLTHHQVPANDGGLALGQAWVAANQLLV
jgi:hydrogenase maturation protein HypF